MKRVIVLAIVLALLMTMCVGCSSDMSEDADTHDSVEDMVTDEVTEVEAGSDVEELVLVDDDIVKVTFEKIFDYPSISGACYLQLMVENKSGQSITVYLTDAYVNDTSVTIGSGVPMDIEPGKKSQNPFIIFNWEKSDIETLEFKVKVYDDAMNSLDETETVTVGVPE